MKPTAAKFTVTQLAKMMGKPPKEVLFLLQGIGVDVKTPDSVLDAATATALLAGKTQAPKSLIVRAGAHRPVRRRPRDGRRRQGQDRARRAQAHQDRREDG